MSTADLAQWLVARFVFFQRSEVDNCADPSATSITGIHRRRWPLRAMDNG